MEEIQKQCRHFNFMGNKAPVYELPVLIWRSGWIPTYGMPAPEGWSGSHPTIPRSSSSPKATPYAHGEVEFGVHSSRIPALFHAESLPSVASTTLNWSMSRGMSQTDLLQNVKRVSPWLVELVSNTPAMHFQPLLPPIKKPRLLQHTLPDLSLRARVLPPLFATSPVCYSFAAGIPEARQAQLGTHLCLNKQQLNHNVVKIAERDESVFLLSNCRKSPGKGYSTQSVTTLENNPKPVNSVNGGTVETRSSCLIVRAN